MSHLEVLTPEKGAVLQLVAPPVSCVVCSPEMLTIRVLLHRPKILTDTGKAYSLKKEVAALILKQAI